MVLTPIELIALGKRALLVGLLLACTVGGSMPAVAAESIVLGPNIDFNPVGDQHTVVAFVVDAGGQPIAGRQVDFEILSGPHAGARGSDITDASGHAAFTYTGTAAGLDTIMASFVDSSGTRQTSNAVRKQWFVPLCGNGVIDPGEQCEPHTLCAGECNPVIGVCFDIGCRSDCTCPCGDGIVDPGEQCDDGNHLSGDGCSPGCLIERCPLGAGFWKNHPEAWQVDSLELGRETYSKAELLAILGTSTGSGSDADASLVLADQMIAAELNIAGGSAITPEIDPVLFFQDPLSELSGRLPYGVDPDSPIGQKLIDAADVLEKYNKGKFTTECSRMTTRSRSSVIRGERWVE
ncbi:MAG: hypothetical protein AUH92_06200 [Acidobacteria bacterium 13_1_40CM_4_69_4]|nr:MAG: hypothetical protein AUH92_06200 [Acidobacteria bacterium 13_1_40CM_4_69_4]